MTRQNRCKIESTLEEIFPEALRFLEEIVGINSYTLNPSGVNENAERVIRQFAPFGFKGTRIPCAEPGTGDHLILDSGGEGPVISCISHLDTVFPAEEEARNDFRWRRDGDRIYGPGTSDIKGGTALLWMTLRALQVNDPELFQKTRWILIWNAAEEGLAPDFGRLCLETLPSDTKACLVFEQGAGTIDRLSLVSARKGRANVRISVSGRGAHAGGAYEMGANAVHQLARLIDRATALTDLSRGTTVNVGVVEGGSVTNRVPDRASATLEIRAFSSEALQEVRSALVAFAGEGDVRAVRDGFPCRVWVEIYNEVAAWPENERTESLLDLWRSTAEACGITLEGARRGGLSDGNWIWDRFPTLDGLGPQGGNAHVSEWSEDGSKVPEYIDVTSFIPKALINTLAIRELIGASLV